MSHDPHMDSYGINLLELFELTPDEIQMLRQEVRRTFSWYPISLTYATPVRVPHILQPFPPEQPQDQRLQGYVPPPPQPQLHTFQQVYLCRVICHHS